MPTFDAFHDSVASESTNIEARRQEGKIVATLLVACCRQKDTTWPFPWEFLLVYTGFYESPSTEPQNTSVIYFIWTVNEAHSPI